MNDRDIIEKHFKGTKSGHRAFIDEHYRRWEPYETEMMYLMQKARQDEREKSAKENAELKKENKELRDCHESELGVCYLYCDRINKLKKEIAELRELSKVNRKCIADQKQYLIKYVDEIQELKARWERLEEQFTLWYGCSEDKRTMSYHAFKRLMRELSSGGESGKPAIKSPLADSGKTAHEDTTSKQKSVGMTSLISLMRWKSSRQSRRR